MLKQTTRFWWLAPLVLIGAGCSRDTAPATVSAAAVPIPATSASAFTPDAPAPAPEPAIAEWRVPRGTPLHVRIDQTVSTHNNRAGDGFAATLVRPLRLPDGAVLASGTRFRGHVTTADASGRLKGRAVIGVTLDSFHAGGREHRISTGSLARYSQAHKKRNAVLIGGGSGLGAAIGAIAGGGKGAAIGALAGAGAGTAGAAATGKLQVAIPAESPLTFTAR